MGVFDDKKYEKLDWMTQITETIESEVNVILAQMPDEIHVTYSMIKNNLNNYNRSISSGIVLLDFMGGNQTSTNLCHEETQKIFKCFEFQMSEGFNVDFEAGHINGELKLVKIKSTLDDQDLQPIMGVKGLEYLRFGAYDNSMLSRMNEILDMLGSCEDHMRNKSPRKKIGAIQTRLSTIFKTNEWRVRDNTLANKIAYWCKNYIIESDLSALTNLCKVKVLSHSGAPIYSIEETT